MDKTAFGSPTFASHASWTPTKVLVIGAGNGGKASAADLAIQVGIVSYHLDIL